MCCFYSLPGPSPDPVRNVTAVVKGNDIEVSWQHPRIATAVTYSFGVYISSTGKDWEKYKHNIPVSKGPSLVMRNLDAGKYHIRVVSYGAYAISKPSSTIIVTVKAGRL